MTDREYKYGLHPTDKNPAEESSAGIRAVLKAEMFIPSPEERVHSDKEYPLQENWGYILSYSCVQSPY